MISLPASASTSDPSTAPLHLDPDLIAAYSPPAGGYDELLDAAGNPRAIWSSVIKALLEMPIDRIAARLGKIERQLFENGITFTIPHDHLKADRPWQLDPMPLIIGADEWAHLSAGVAERARLFNAILSDAYGEMELLQDGSLPPELILASPNFLTAMSGAPHGAVSLFSYAVDVARGPDGSWRVLRDLCCQSEGVGYALENRVLLNDFFRDEFAALNTRRLAGYFGDYHNALLELAGHPDPRVVTLAPPPSDSRYFAIAYIARYLGYPLAEAPDLTVRDRTLYLKTLDGLKRVDILIRKITGRDCDALESPTARDAGIPGLMSVIRAGNVVVVNSPGSDLVEERALNPFLPAIAQKLNGRPLTLASPEIWWAGDAHGREAILADPQAFKLFSMAGSTPSAPPSLDQIAHQGANYGAERAFELATTPVFAHGRLHPAAFTLRLFATRTGEGPNADYQVMPGGLARVGPTGDGAAVMSDRFTPSGSKDVWVLSDAPVSAVSRLPASRRRAVLRRTGKALPSRAADNLFWLGRYAERAENTCRLLRNLIATLTQDFYLTREVGAMLQALMPLAAKADIDPQDGGDDPAAQLRHVLAMLVYDPDRAYGLYHSLSNLKRSASLVRDRLSVDAWRTLGHLRPDDLLPLKRLDLPFDDGDLSEALDALNDTLRSLSAFSGIEMENMTRNHSWRFRDMGRRIERGSHMVTATAQLVGADGEEEDGRLVLLLDMADSVMTYRSRYLTTPILPGVLDLLLLDETNPRSIAFQILRLQQLIDGLPGNAPTPPFSEEQRRVVDMLTRLRLSEVEALIALDDSGGRPALTALLAHVSDQLDRLSDALARSYFSHADSRREGVFMLSPEAV